MAEKKEKAKQFSQDRNKIIRKFRGLVVSTKMDKTAVVKVTRIKVHPKYGKRYHVSKKFHVHDPRNECQVGERVEFKEIRPLSKTKRWKIVKKLN